MPSPVVVAYESPYPYLTAQQRKIMGDILPVKGRILPGQSRHCPSVVEVPHTKRGKESHQLHRRLIYFSCCHTPVLFAVPVGVKGQLRMAPGESVEKSKGVTLRYDEYRSGAVIGITCRILCHLGKKGVEVMHLRQHHLLQDDRAPRKAVKYICLPERRIGNLPLPVYHLIVKNCYRGDKGFPHVMLKGHHVDYGSRIGWKGDFQIAFPELLDLFSFGNIVPVSHYPKHQPFRHTVCRDGRTRHTGIFRIPNLNGIGEPCQPGFHAFITCYYLLLSR